MAARPTLGAATIDLANLKLYGRSDEVAALFDAYRRVLRASRGEPPPSSSAAAGASEPNPSELVLVSGYSGTGKSSLIRHLKCHVEGKAVSQSSADRGGRFASGKFDQLRRAEPYSAIVTAFDGFFGRLLDDPDALRQTRDAIVDAVSADGRSALANLIPGLQTILSLDALPAAGASSGSAQARNRFNAAFRSLVKSVCSPPSQRPLILFLDDVQWADIASLDLIKFLLTDADSSNVLFILSYRDNEVARSHPLTLRMRDVEECGAMSTITKVHVDNLGVGTVNELISDVLRIDASDTRPLADVVVRRTRGNVFFVIRFLESLRDEGLLVYSLGSYRWTWDVDAIESSTVISDNVVDLVLGKLRKFPGTVQAVLKAASCLGSVFDVAILEKTPGLVTHDDDQGSGGQSSDLSSCLGIAVDEGLVEGVRAMTYKFVHDKIQQAAYSLFEDERDKELLHLCLGGIMRRQSMSGEKNQESVDWMLFTMVDQLNLGSKHMNDRSERTELARLNRQAGARALHSCAYFPASSYLRTGIALLDQDNMWKDEYDLTLGLHNELAAAEYVCGNIKGSKESAIQAIGNAQSMDDKMEAYYTLYKLKNHGEANPEGALDVGAEFLKGFGETFSQNPSGVSVRIEFLRMRWTLRAYSFDELLMLPLMDDKEKRAVVRMMMMMTPSSYALVRPNLYAMICFRVIQLSLKYGMSSITALAYAMYGSLLCSKANFEEGHRYGQLAMSLLDRLRDNDWRGPTKFCVYGCINHWKEPLQQTLDPLLHNYENSFLHGDPGVAFMSLLSYLSHYLYSGMPLGPLEADMRAYCHQMTEYNQNAVLPPTLCVWQFVLDMMGRSEDSIKLAGDSATRDMVSSVMQVQRAYYFGDLVLASNLVTTSRRYAKEMNVRISFDLCRFTFFDGLVSLAMARKENKKKWIVSARGVIKRMTRWTESAAVNILHMLLLLKAELAAALKKNGKEIKSRYDIAISTAARNGFTQDQALASERAGVYFLDKGDTDWASFYLSRAHQLYLAWEAQAKADSLHSQHLNLLKDSHPPGVTSRGLRGRSRFDDKSQSHKKLLHTLNPSLSTIEAR